MTRGCWTDDQIAVLRARYPHEPSAVVAAAIGQTLRNTYSKAAALGILKSPEYLASDAACRLRRGDNVGAASRFKPGHVTWNKGTHFAAGGRSVETRFRAGQMPVNTRALGVYRVVVDKRGVSVLERKISMHGKNNSERWKAVTRLVWEAAHGPIPDKHIVCWRNISQASVDLAAITVDKLECISRAELARRNHPRNRSPELAKLVQLKGAITRQVNRISRATPPAQPSEKATP